MAADGLHLGRGRFIPAGELLETTSLSGGPGGQHANKTSSRVTLSWNLRASEALHPALIARLEAKLASRITNEGLLQVHVDSNRSQHRNRDEARERLTNLLTEALKVDKQRRATKPSRGAKQRRLEGKKRRSDVKKSRQTPGDD